jgi:hypothetical protein
MWKAVLLSVQLTVLAACQGSRHACRSDTPSRGGVDSSVTGHPGATDDVGTLNLYRALANIYSCIFTSDFIPSQYAISHRDITVKLHISPLWYRETQKLGQTWNSVSFILPPVSASFLLELFFEPEDWGNLSPKRRDYFGNTLRYNTEEHVLHDQCRENVKFNRGVLRDQRGGSPTAVISVL